MREYWEQMYEESYDPKLLHQLSLLLFMKRADAGAPQPGDDCDAAYASQEETARAIQAVLRIRHDFLRSKNIADMRHVLTEEERAELVKRAREEYESSDFQVQLQNRDAEKGKAKGKNFSAAGSRCSSACEQRQRKRQGQPH